MAFRQSTDKRVAVFLADGLEEIEGLTVVDLLYRAGIPCDTVSISDTRDVVSSHQVHLVADRLLGELDWDAYDMLVLPGGMPGTTHLGACEPLCARLREFAAAGKGVAAICAAPSVLAQQGILRGRNATSNPNFRDACEAGGAIYHEDPVVVDDNVITSRGMGTAIDFGFAIVRHYLGEAAVDDLKGRIVWQGR